MKKERLIVIGPLPPPYHGVTVSTALVLANPLLGRRFEVEHLDTSDHRTGENVGKWDLKNIWLAILALRRLVRCLRGRSGVVYLPLSQSTPGVLRDSLFVFGASLRGWKIAVHLRGSEFRAFYTRSHPFMRRWVRSMLGRVDSVAVMGTSLKSVFDGLVPADKIVVVANGTPAPSTLLDDARDPEHVLFLSNLRLRKGVIEGLETALRVLAVRRSARFTFAGRWESAELEEALRRRAKASTGRIDFIPPVSGAEKDQLLASASVLLFPPVEPEGHPRVVLEALAAGIPVVTTDRGAIRETVGDGESGFVLDEPDPDRLASCVLRLLDDQSLRERQSKAARERYLSHFTQELADRRLAEWLNDVSK